MKSSPPAGSSSGGTGTSPIYRSVAAPYTVASDDEYITVTVGGLLIIPAPTSTRILKIRRGSSCIANVTFDVTFDGDAKTLLVPKESVEILWNGTSWEEWP